MKNAMLVLAVLVVMAAPAFAVDGNVSQTTLKSVGLSELQQMSDSEGMQVRGRLNGNGGVIGTSLISFQLVSPDTKNYINGASINTVDGNVQLGGANEMLSKAHGVAISPAVVLSVSVTDMSPNNFTFAGSVLGQIGGAGSVKLGAIGN